MKKVSALRRVPPTDGGFAWWLEDGNIAAVTEAGVSSRAGDYGEDDDYTVDVGLLDSETGEEIWRSQADSWEVQGDVVYLTDGERCAALTCRAARRSGRSRPTSPSTQTIPC